MTLKKAAFIFDGNPFQKQRELSLLRRFGGEGVKVFYFYFVQNIGFLPFHSTSKHMPLLFTQPRIVGLVHVFPHPFVCMYLQALAAKLCLPLLNIKIGSVCSV